MAGTEFFLDVFLRRKIRNARTNSTVNIVNSRDPFPPSGEMPKSSSIVCMVAPLGIERGPEVTRLTTRASSICAYCRIKPLEVKLARQFSIYPRAMNLGARGKSDRRVTEVLARLALFYLAWLRTAHGTAG
jgi:hypothetical protein